MLRLTKAQRQYQESVISAYAATGIKAEPSTHLVADLFEKVYALKQLLEYEKSKSLWRIFRERYF